MRRIDTSTAVPDLFGPGKPGFRNGNKALAIPATELNAEFFNALQEEAANVIEAAGLTLDPDDNTQLLQAMRIILSNADMIARFTTTGNIVLNGLAVQAGGDWPANLTANDFILVKDQATPANNGWYRAQAGAWTRVVYLDEDNEVSAGMLTKVSEGATLADSIWMLITDNPIDVGTTALTFSRKDAVTIADATTAVKGKVQLGTSTDFNGTGDTDKAQTAASIIAGLLGAGGNSANDYITIPFKDKTTGVRRNLIIQWGQSATVAGDNSVTVTFPITFPNACLSVIATVRNSTSSNTDNPAAHVVSWTVSQVILYLSTYASVPSFPMTYLAIGW